MGSNGHHAQSAVANGHQAHITDTVLYNYPEPKHVVTPMDTHDAQDMGQLFSDVTFVSGSQNRQNGRAGIEPNILHANEHTRRLSSVNSNLELSYNNWCQGTETGSNHISKQNSSGYSVCQAPVTSSHITISTACQPATDTQYTAHSLDVYMHNVDSRRGSHSVLENTSTTVGFVSNSGNTAVAGSYNSNRSTRRESIAQQPASSPSSYNTDSHDTRASVVYSSNFDCGRRQYSSDQTQVWEKAGQLKMQAFLLRVWPLDVSSFLRDTIIRAKC